MGDFLDERKRNRKLWIIFTCCAGCNIVKLPHGRNIANVGSQCHGRDMLAMVIDVVMVRGIQLWLWGDKNRYCEWVRFYLSVRLSIVLIKSWIFRTDLMQIVELSNRKSERSVLATHSDKYASSSTSTTNSLIEPSLPKHTANRIMSSVWNASPCDGRYCWSWHIQHTHTHKYPKTRDGRQRKQTLSFHAVLLTAGAWFRRQFFFCMGFRSICEDTWKNGKEICLHWAAAKDHRRALDDNVCVSISEWHDRDLLFVSVAYFVFLLSYLPC